MNENASYWALRQMEDARQYLVGRLRETDHLLLHETREAALDMAHDLAFGDWLDAVEVVPARLGLFSHFILHGKAYALHTADGSADRTGWSQRRLQNTEAYLRHVVNEGGRAIYDAEQHRLLWLDVKAEIDRRKEAGQWQTSI